MRQTFGFVIGLFVLLGLGHPAQAALILAVDINGSQACASDNDSGCTFGATLGDLNPAVGVISLAPTTISGVLVEGSLHTATFSSTNNLLSSGSLAITNQSGVTANVQASIGATGFNPITSYVQSTGSGTWITSEGSSTTYTFWNDLADAQGAETATDRPGTQVGGFTDTAGAGVDSFSYDTGFLPLIRSNPFSMTLGFDMTLLAGDRLETRGQAELTDVQAIPEPMTMMLLGSGLLGGGYLRRRR